MSYMGDLANCKTGRYAFNAICLILLLVSFGCSDQATHQQLFSLQMDLAMPRNRVAIIIAGMNQKTSMAEYHRIGDYYKSKGIAPVYADIDWKHTGLANLATAASQMSAEIKKTYPDSKVFLFGFSFGAVIAYKLSESVNPAHTLLCSMSPVFTEDRNYQIFPFRQVMGMVTDYSSNHLAYPPNGGRSMVFLYGEREFLINNAIIAHRKSIFTNSTTITVQGTGHDISNPLYLGVIKKVVSEIP